MFVLLAQYLSCSQVGKDDHAKILWDFLRMANEPDMLVVSKGQKRSLLRTTRGGQNAWTGLRILVLIVAFCGSLS